MHSVHVQKQFPQTKKRKKKRGKNRSIAPKIHVIFLKKKCVKSYCVFFYNFSFKEFFNLFSTASMYSYKLVSALFTWLCDGRRKSYISSNPRFTVLASTGQGQILGHDTVNVNSVNNRLLNGLREGHNLGGSIELSSLDQTTGPGKDRCNGVSGGLLALLVLPVVASDSSVGGLRLESLTVGGDEDRGHETERSEALGNNVGLDVTVVVLHGDDVAALGFDHLGDHVVDETVLVPDLCGLELGLVCGVVDLLEDVLEPSVVLLEDGVLGAHVQRELLLDGELE
jgi:hypothetical protein